MLSSELISKLQELAADNMALDWDNPGLITGRRDKEVKKIYLALDATDEVVDACIKEGVDMLLTHHPLIFGSIRKINQDDFLGRRLMKFISNDIICYAMHTNFDVCCMADCTAQAMKLENCQVLDLTYENDGNQMGIGKVGSLPKEMTLKECAQYVKECFKIENVKVFGNPESLINTVALSPGAGKATLSTALKSNADVFVTGDIDHHAGIDAVASGINIIDAGHYGTEKIFVPYMKEFLEKNTELQVICQEDVSPFWII